MSRHYEITRRRAAAMVEMGNLGCTASDVAMLLEIELSRVSQIGKDFGIRLPKARKGRPPILREYILKHFGKGGMMIPAIAERFGTTPNSVSATISTLRRNGELPPIRKPIRASGDLSYFHISSAVNYQKW